MRHRYGSGIKVFITLVRRGQEEQVARAGGRSMKQAKKKLFSIYHFSFDI
jgi:hypothetical protein